MRGSWWTVLAALVAVALVAGSSAGCADDTPESVPRGEVVSVAPVLELSTEQTAEYLRGRGLDVPARNGIEALRVEYTTVDPEGAQATASGLVILPHTGARSLRAVSFAHGTIVRKDEAPSLDGETARGRAIMFAASGYAVTAPDYLGLGTGPGRHPYAHSPTEASASLDLLRAARAVAGDRGRKLDRRVLVTGFSQGGQAATALAEQLGTGEVPDFELAAVAAVSGPYDVRGVQAPAALDGRVLPRSAVVFFAYWITAMNRIYPLYDDPSEAFQPPYDERVEELFDGHHDIVSVGTSLPATPQELLTPRFLDQAHNPEGAAAQAVVDSDGTCRWNPQVPVRLYAATGDRSVPYANSEHCLRDLNSPQAELISLGDIGHSESAAVALPQILDWFRQVAPPT
ncbi:alpha/beta hydrolase [Nocardia donostiensis]|uniref:Alpha/beta hydrolase n=1 Tax=Nocardia donostiensis TaxID=1538463 RepID=A0A1W0ASB6_9NOCA|nr:alpha/beta hydrolase [Nocardia donostiensis]ONM47959.1 hypothetical protein B0T46_15085 [Nocardia donostiensis]OQS13128.1 hypothetical protein B0T36_21535 [Nocardia donostiensis]OQS21502.1 hypothetical protein B0T44_07690 [Nocardia donostiensis]